MPFTQDTQPNQNIVVSSVSGMITQEIVDSSRGLSFINSIQDLGLGVDISKLDGFVNNLTGDLSRFINRNGELNRAEIAATTGKFVFNFIGEKAFYLIPGLGQIKIATDILEIAAPLILSQIHARAEAGNPTYKAISGVAEEVAQKFSDGVDGIFKSFNIFDSAPKSDVALAISELAAEKNPNIFEHTGLLGRLCS